MDSLYIPPVLHLLDIYVEILTVIIFVLIVSTKQLASSRTYAN